MVLGVLGAAFGAGTDAPSDGEPAGSEHAHVQAVMAEAALPGQPAASTAEEQAGGGEPGGGAEAADGGRARTGAAAEDAGSGPPGTVAEEP